MAKTEILADQDPGVENGNRENGNREKVL